jgi:hypothetical protein
MCEHTANTSLQYCAAKKRASNVQTQQVHKHTDTTLSVARIYNNVTQFLQKKKNNIASLPTTGQGVSSW